MKVLSKEEKRDIQDYFQLDERIKEKKQHMKLVRRNSYNQSLCTRIEPTDLALSPVAFRVESQVTDLVTSLDDMKITLQMLQKKQRYLEDYMSSLPL
ncbi:hypothetical protein [Alkalicoccus halolimnae]|uniref:Uncharacterized protein n=1 Tax=Alkalicoccus halolimnae TaxID=1667239 RepID=A0A5C7FN64_9BACI|nr:hypothetical protein [Alkalicoccus halolimnae]TXF86215.1 hypothetical protein FTX54_06300 [Alkalicoccus halolimnae]